MIPKSYFKEVVIGCLFLVGYLALDSIYIVQKDRAVIVFDHNQFSYLDTEPGLHFKLPIINTFLPVDFNSAKQIVE